MAPRGVSRLAVGLACSLACSLGCATAAKEAGEEAAEGALSSLAGEEPKKSPPEHTSGTRPEGEAMTPVASEAAREIGRGAAAGIVGHLSRPDGLRDVETLAEGAGAAFARAFSRELAAQLEAEGLPAALSTAGAHASAGAVRGVATELGAAFPECRGPDAGACIRREVEAMGHAGASGALRAAGIGPLLLAAAGGAAFALLAVAAVGGLGARRSARRLEVRRASP